MSESDEVIVTIRPAESRTVSIWSHARKVAGLKYATEAAVLAGLEVHQLASDGEWCASWQAGVRSFLYVRVKS